MPYKDPAKRNARRRERRAAQRKAPKEFIGVDGEGGNVGDSHIYNLLTVGNINLIGKPALSTRECLQLIARLPNDYIYVSYYFDYDVTMILRDLEQEKIKELLDRDARTYGEKHITVPISWNEFDIEYMPNKEFRVRYHGGTWGVINDVSSFFQCSFLKAITDWDIGTPEERKLIEDGKAKRSNFTELEQSTINYNALEIKLLQELMTEYREVFIELDIRPWKWQGPGQIATSVFKKFNVTKNKELTLNEEFLVAAQSSYYGGWFEVSRFGLLEMPLWNYDINSAYPYAMLTLPCLEHGQWVKTDNPHGLYLAHVTWMGNDEMLWHSFPHRNKHGNISHPATGSAWVWSHEVEQALPGDNYTIDSAWMYVRNCNCKPFDFVEGLYELRKSLGKNTKGMALKTTINSLYGKLAQSIGNPSYSNPVWASLITSHCRAQILSAMKSNPDAVVMVATDGIYSTEPLDVPVSSQLGDWECEQYHSMFIIQPGVYVADGSLRAVKSRGTAKRIIIERLDDIISNWNKFVSRYGEDEWNFLLKNTATEIEIDRFMSLRIANARRNYRENVGQWIVDPKRLKFDWSAKRAIEGGVVMGTSILTRPLVSDGVIESVPYDKNIGGLTDFSLNEMIKDQPDWMLGLYGVE